MPPFDLVIFDCDGVLVDSERVASRVLCEILSSYGPRVTPQDVVVAFKGKTLAEHPQIAKETFGIELAETFEEIYHAQLFDAFQQDLKPIDGIQQVLAALTIPYCVASNSVRARVERSLAVTHLKHYFEDRIFTVDDVARGKPAPDLFLFAAQRMNAQPEKCLVIEDNPGGVMAGVAAGMTVFGFADLTPAEKLESAGAQVFINMTDVIDLIDSFLEK